ncbi:hypothetical protein [Blastococcus atacamensis]|uniref:hypothetical protein n=1 Tax=Blastococcus atacamensis TaxID=2070508 RepID=UPI001E371006|nr:hypothetical protein [Blastococcus atacamensis]
MPGTVGGTDRNAFRLSTGRVLHPGGPLHAPRTPPGGVDAHARRGRRGRSRAVGGDALSLFPMPTVADLRAHLLARDVVWVGGGSVAT